MHKIVRILAVLKGAEAAFELLTISKSGSTMDCFSSSTNAAFLAHFWDDAVGKLGDDVLSCKVNGVFSPISKNEIHNLIKEVSDPTSSNVLLCGNRIGDEIEISSDGKLENSEPAHVSCDEERRVEKNIVRVAFRVEDREPGEGKGDGGKSQGGGKERKGLVRKYSSSEVEEKVKDAVDRAVGEVESEKIKSLNDLKREIEASREEHERRIGELTLQKTMHSDEIHNLKRELEKMKKNSTFSARMIMEKGELIKVLEEENKKLQKESLRELSQVQASERDLVRINQQIMNEVESLKRGLKERDQELEGLRKEVEGKGTKEKDMEEIRASLQRKMIENKRLHDEMNEARELASKREEEIRRLRDRVREEERRANLASKQTRENDEKFKVTSSTTIKSILLLSAITSVASSSGVFDENTNKCPHVKNRPGSGKYVVDGITDASCSPVDYGVSCAGFNLLMNTEKFPFFNAHMHHRSLLEAYHDKLVEKDAGRFCIVNDTSTPAECSGELMHFYSKCPENIRGVHYLTNDGKIAGMTCKEGHEVSGNCKFCVKLKDSASLTTASMPLQDMVCQAGTSPYNGPIMKLKGVCAIGGRMYKHCTNHRQDYEKVPFILLNGKGKQYLDTLVIRNKEQHNPDAFLCHTYNRIIGESSSIDTNEKIWRRVKVRDCKIVDDSKTKKCTGDAVFCNHYHCDKEFAEAYCSVSPGAGPIEVLYGGSWVKPQCIGYEETSVMREVDSRDDRGTSECSTCVTECGKDEIVVRSIGFKMISAVACSHGSCITSVQKPDTEIRVEYPGLSASTGGRIGIHISHDDPTISAHVTVVCPPRDPCEVHDCIICAHGLINYQCHTVASAFMVIMMLTMAGSLGIFIIIRILRILKIIPKRLASPLVWSKHLMLWIVRKVRHSIHHNMENINNEIGWRDVEADRNVRQRRGDERIDMRPIPRYAFKIGLMMALIGVCSGCSETVIASSKITRCANVNDKMTCTYGGTVTLKAGTIGSETCLILRGPSGETKKYISIKTLASELTCREGQSYWTGQFSPKCLSSRRCHLVAECQKTRCLEWRDSDLSSEFSGMGNNSVMNENKCFEQSGGVGYGCFNINPSCLFVHSYLKSTKPEGLKVFSCVDWVHRLKFEVKNPSGNVETVVMSGMSTKFTEWGSITLGLDAESITGSNSMSFMKSSKNEFALIDEEFSMIPREGFIGEIRCSSESAVIAAHSSCLRAPNLIKYRPMLDTVECTTSLIDPFSVFYRGALPQTRNGKTYTGSMDRTTVQAISSAIVQAELTLVLDGYDVEFEVETAKCSASFLNISGCYSCNEGARVCFKIKSDKDGVLTAHNKDMSVNFLTHVSTGTKDYCKIMHFGRPEIEEPLMYGCGGDESPIVIKGTLIAFNPFDDRREDGGKSTVVNPRVGDWSFFGWADGLFSWMGGPVRAILTLIGYVIGAIVVMIIIMALIKMLIHHLMDMRRMKDR
uniref:Envelopment polyprotein n=1 Tax=Karimabad virus TaxID=415382 RepID=W8JCL9_9VIRU|nr:membrane glycoprotein [Karimabad virus]